MDGKRGLTNIGSRVRDHLADDPAAGDELRRGRAAFLDEVERRNAASSLQRSSPRGRGRWRLLVLSASVAAGAAGVWLWTRPPTFEIGEAHRGKLGDVIEAADGRVTPIAFSEGSTLSLRDGGRIRVLALDAGDARVLVEDGVVDADIERPKRGKTRWEFELGPYRVTVNGTKFRMAFRASDRSLRVSTQEGRVTVAGGCLDGPKSVSAGESLDATCPPREAPPADDRAADTAALGVPPTAARADLATTLKPARVERWREPLAAGRLLEGLRAAERANFAEVCRTATAKELLALADAGRFFGPPQRAVTALGALRQRFPGSMDAAMASFTLGRIAFEKQHAYADAARWFESYLVEQPSGPLMGDAFGRLMEARHRAGDTAGARASAEQYLRRFPEGPYASEARGILSR